VTKEVSVAKKQDRLRPEGPTWCQPGWNGDAIDRYFAEELRAAGYDHVLKRNIHAANRAWDIYRRSWSTLKDLRQINDALAPYWLPYIHSDELHGTLLRELVTVVERVKPTHVLDVGCGVGFDACFLAKQFPKISVRGTDCSPAMIALATVRAQRRNLANAAFSVTTHRDLPSRFPTERFDFIYAHGSLSYINPDDLRSHMLGICRVLRPGGVFFCEIPIAVNADGFISCVIGLDIGLTLLSDRYQIRTLKIQEREVAFYCAFRLEIDP